MIKTNGFQSVWNYLRSTSNTDGDIVINLPLFYILLFRLTKTIWKLHQM